MLEVIVSAGDLGIAKADLANEVEMTASGGTFGSYMSVLRTNGLVTTDGGVVVATGILWPEGT